MASVAINSWQIDGETIETVTNFIFLGSKITADCYYSLKIKRCLLLGRKAMTNIDSILKSTDITLPTKAHLVKTMVFLIVVYGCESWTIKKAWALKNWCFWTVVLEKTLESPFDCKEIKPVHPKGNQSWIFIGRTHAEAEAPVLWPPDAKNWLLGKDADAGKDWEQKGTVEDEIVGWHHQLDGHEFEQPPGVGDGQGSLVFCSPSDYKELDTTEQATELTELSHGIISAHRRQAREVSKVSRNLEVEPSGGWCLEWEWIRGPWGPWKEPPSLQAHMTSTGAGPSAFLGLEGPEWLEPGVGATSLALCWIYLAHWAGLERWSGAPEGPVTPPPGNRRGPGAWAGTCIDKVQMWGLPWWPVVKIPVQGAWVQSLVGELRSHMLYGKKRNKLQNINRSNIVTNSIKTLKVNK